MIKNKEIQDLLLEIKPEFNSFGNGFQQFPNSITIHKETKDGIVIDLYLINDVLTAQIWLNEDDEYILNDFEISYIYVYLKSLLDDEVRLTKQYYEQEHEQQQTYYIK
tara:strand:+ start:2299 stop:2622 length:324 start_codon:yes stop_codon:yes gene_type:complete